MLQFSKANTKTKKLTTIPELKKYLRFGRKVYSLDLLSGWSCPGAKDCLSKAYVSDDQRKLVDGPYTLFRCFSASQEVLYPNVYDLRKRNFEVMKLLRTQRQIANAILDNLPKDVGIVRYHVGGDFFKLTYLQGALLAAEWRQDVLFYGYTKMINYLCSIQCDNLSKGIIRPNFLITASMGGKYDNLIKNNNIRNVKVIYHTTQADNLPIDHDDSHAATIGGNFALLLHGVQPKGSKASQALQALKGKGSYKR